MTLRSARFAAVAALSLILSFAIVGLSPTTAHAADYRIQT